MKLRDYQTEAVRLIQDYLERRQRAHILFTMATGGGKTPVMSRIAHDRKGAVLVLVHRVELVDQTIHKLIATGVDPEEIGRVTAKATDPGHHHVKVAMVPTLHARLSKHGPSFLKDLFPDDLPPLVICDEAHHLVAPTWLALLTGLRRAFPLLQLLGVTATAGRADGKGLKAAGFTDIVHGPDTAALIAMGYLRRLHAFSLPYVPGMDAATLMGRPVVEYKRHAAGRQALAFCRDINHAKALAAEFRANGINAVHLDGNHDADTRNRAVRRYQDGITKVLVNVDLFGEGTDFPECGCVILACKTGSEARFRQRVGRAMRIGAIDRADGVVIDCEGSYQDYDPESPYLQTLEDQQTFGFKGDPKVQPPRAEQEQQKDSAGDEEEVAKQLVDLVKVANQEDAFRLKFRALVATMKKRSMDLMQAVHRACAKRLIQDVTRLVWATDQCTPDKTAAIVVAREYRLADSPGALEKLADLLGMTLADVLAIYRPKRAQQLALPPVEPEPVAPAPQPVKDVVGGTEEGVDVDPVAKAKVEAYIAALGDAYVEREGIAAAEFGSHPDGLNDPGGVFYSGTKHFAASKVLKAAGLVSTSVGLRVDGRAKNLSRWLTPDAVAAKALVSSTTERMNQWLEANAEFAAANNATTCLRRFLADGWQGGRDTMQRTVTAWRKKKGLPSFKRGGQLGNSNSASCRKRKPKVA